MTPFIAQALKRLSQQNRLTHDKSPFWYFIHRWHKDALPAIIAFISGSYRFEPIKTYLTKENPVVVWCYQDRLFVKALLFLIKSTFTHIISPQCLHLSGPSGVKKALDLTHKALDSGKFRYFMRIDIQGFYASIDRKLLFQQVQQHFHDPRILNYFEQIIHIPILKDGAIHIPEKGIHRRSGLSPFFGALYLSPLDQALEALPGVWFVRYMDDVLVLCRTKRQFCQAKKCLQAVLKTLQLTCAPSKTIVHSI
jgi:hypothetical protein